MPVRILVVGSLVLDHVVRVPRFPAAGENVPATDFRTFPGGKGANQAVAASRLGAEVTMLGCVGDDDAGRVLLNAVAAEGINVGGIATLPGPGSGAALVALDPTGQNTICVALGANLLMTGARVTPGATADAVLAQLETDVSASEAAMALDAAIRILNPAPATPVPEAIWRRVTVATPNEHECALLTGILPHDRASCDEGAAWFHERGVERVAITLGATGVWASWRGDGRLIAATPVEAVDTVGAGDAFNGALAVALGEGTAFFEACAFASRAASLAVTRPGGIAGMPRRSEL